MCGIVGLSLLEPGGRCDLDRAVRALAHRGPDGRGVHVDRHFALGHTRLAIIDLSEQGAQPMWSADRRYVMVYNGEIYNFADLRRKLEARGARFRGHSDSEVLLEGYSAFGPDFIAELNGIFAVAIADVASKELFVARDPLGVKPLYWSEGPFGFAFSSEIKALLRLAPIEREIDPIALQQYLTFLWAPGERTLFKEVRKLDPGTAFFVRDGRIARRWRYWSPPAYAPRRDWTRRECAVQLGDGVTQAVTRQMVSDAPVGAFLSGGVDSTAIVAAASRSNPDIECFTMRMEGGNDRSEGFDDLGYARLAARHFGVRLVEVPVEPQDITSNIERMVFDLDEPLADPSCLNLYLMSKAARERGIKVLLSGAGGDDLMSGYRRHTAAVYDGFLDYLPSALRRTLARSAQSGQLARPALRRITKVLRNSALGGDDRIARMFAWAPDETVASVVASDIRSASHTAEVWAPLSRELTGLGDAPDLEKCLALDRRFFLTDHNLTYADKMGMAASVEVRVPLLDLELVSFAAQIPAEWKHRGLTAKWLFKQSQRGAIPDRIINRPKTGFGVPLRGWMRGSLRGLLEDLLSEESLTRRGLFNAKAVRRLIHDNSAGSADASYLLFSLMCIESWCRTFADSAWRPSPETLSAAPVGAQHRPRRNPSGPDGSDFSFSRCRPAVDHVASRQWSEIETHDGSENLDLAFDVAALLCGALRRAVSYVGWKCRCRFE